MTRVPGGTPFSEGIDYLCLRYLCLQRSVNTKRARGGGGSPRAHWEAGGRRSTRPLTALRLLGAQRQEQRAAVALDGQQRGLAVLAIERRFHVGRRLDDLAVDLLDHVTFGQLALR